jgi:hypothetical protein
VWTEQRCFKKFSRDHLIRTIARAKQRRPKGKPGETRGSQRRVHAITTTARRFRRNITVASTRRRLPSIVSGAGECGRGHLQAFKLPGLIKTFCSKQKHNYLSGSLCSISCWVRCITSEKLIRRPNQGVGATRQQEGAAATTTAARRCGRNRDGRTKLEAPTATAAETHGRTDDARKRRGRNHERRKELWTQPRRL